MSANRSRSVPPRAGAMVEALRGLGYSVESALADIIDNSLSAGATEVRVDFLWAGAASRISILDNGKGMSDGELEHAMQLGARSPLDPRDPGDLGRFGMGLKTASFSHCRSLTVATAQQGQRACLRWDLDVLAENPQGGWMLLEGPARGSEPHVASVGTMQSGTLVLWEKLDRIVTPSYTSDDFNDLIDEVLAHFAMVFHRLLDGPSPRFRLFVNGRTARPWDPFLTGHPSKPWHSPIARTTTSTGQVEAQCHVLPYKDNLSPVESERAAGPRGWSSQQGFYVYRNERLISAGGWLGLGQPRAWNREEAHRLARIRLDITNQADAAWKIDVRKSIARPPVSLRSWLTRLAEDTRERARKVFAYRGSPPSRNGREPVEMAWHAEHTRSGVKYRIDERHPVVASVLQNPAPDVELIRAMLKVIEETVPVQRIWLDTTESRETPSTGFAGEPPASAMSVLMTLYQDMVGRRGMSEEAAKRALSVTEPFHKYLPLISSLPAPSTDSSSPSPEKPT